jgi:hypothetical protein
VALTVGVTGCQPEPSESLREDTTPAVEPLAPKTPPALMVEVGFEDGSALAGWLREVGGYARLVLTNADPEWSAIEDVSVQGPVNPNIRLLDADGDGRLDPTADLDVFSLAGGEGEGGPIAVFPGAANEGTEIQIGVIVYTHTGESREQAWVDNSVRLESGDTPRQVNLTVPTPQGGLPCADGIDNDNDGWTDGDDADCKGGGPRLERGHATATCGDGVDNDGDGDIDAEDSGCRHGADLSELPSCADGIDDDGDTWTDAQDPDCDAGTGEQGLGATPCNDGVDNDLDSFIDALDPGCTSADGTED